MILLSCGDDEAATANAAPTIEDQIFSVAENSPAETEVGRVQATDEDEGSSLTVDITGDVFEINPSNGGWVLITKRSLDHETRDAYVLKVTVTDGELEGTAGITVNVTDVNEAPTIKDESLSLVEYIPSETVVETVTGIDEDEGDVLTYAITGGNTNDDFAIDKNSGAITTARNLDFETTEMYNLTVTATDDDETNPLSGTATLTINIIDVVNEAANNIPTIVGDQSFSVDENAASRTTVGTVDASDADNDALSYSITAGNEAGDFEIDGSTGQITVAKVLDHETAPTYTLTIKIADGNSGEDTGNVTITVKDVNEAPTVTANKTTVYLTDGTIANTTTVAVVEGMDVDENSTFTYSITGGNTNSDFAIDSNTGQITVANTLDRSSTSSYTLTVTVTDNGNLTATIEITVNVTDAANTAPTFADAARSIAENALPGANVGTPVMGMDNENDALTYAIIDGNDGDVFAIDNNGQITVAAGKKLNHEIKGTYILTVTATDAGSGTAVPATVTVTVTDVDEDSENMAPTFANASRTIAENAAAESNVGNPVTATDPENDALTYAINSGNTGDVFAIDNNGQITIAQGKSLDHETGDEYMLAVTATDVGSGTPVQATITITVTDVNEAPKFARLAYTQNVAASAVPGTNVVMVSATDEDDTDTPTYEITNGDTNSDFAIDNSGQITVAKPLTEGTMYTLTVTARDDESIPLTATATVTIRECRGSGCGYRQRERCHHLFHQIGQ
ncbi:MAG: cadherin repeat domain-containing protein [Ekhidna sp.]|nr:cadherin repeat domain-containing protein [Ekhidna sp.]